VQLLIMHLTVVTTIGNKPNTHSLHRKLSKLHRGKHRYWYQTSEFFHLNIRTPDIRNFTRIA